MVTINDTNTRKETDALARRVIVIRWPASRFFGLYRRIQDPSTSREKEPFGLTLVIIPAPNSLTASAPYTLHYTPLTPEQRIRCSQSPLMG